MMSFAWHKFFSFMRSCLWLLTLVLVMVIFCSGSCFLYQCIQGCSLLSFLLDLEYPVLCWSLWSTWTWFLCSVIHMDLIDFFYMPTFCYTTTICWRFLLFSNLCFLLLCQKWSVCRSLGLLLKQWNQFHWPTFLFLCQYSLFFFHLTLLCSKSWGWCWWYFQ